ncbi:FRG1-like family-domain-containing protein [Polychytrium aggregatum]|uniref:FRG1-like family-domain-containing protein n=1 Tax=Polychytrium aggregatum TaxID=110093 RepID=UPI0022FF01F5|nr:FRG1-like family-domain-containing protein [Polychytrium aggregatum]KAI9204456.1 FRG1-like family-domain-containing protein [Polychytrium aggregatum]
MSQAPRTSRLSFKGEEPKKKKKSKKERSHPDGESARPLKDDDIPSEGWLAVDALDDFGGPTMICTPDPLLVLTSSETSDKAVFKAYPASIPLQELEPADVAQVQVAVKLPNSDRYSIKSAFEKYLTVDKFGVVTFGSSAVGPTEEWEVIVKDDGVAFKSRFDRYLTLDQETLALRADSESLGFRETFQVRGQAQYRRQHRKKRKSDAVVDVEHLERDHLKKYQSWGGGRVAAGSSGSSSELKHAQKAGNLNEALLDRRVKIKSDKFCK